MKYSGSIRTHQNNMQKLSKMSSHATHFSGLNFVKHKKISKYAKEVTKREDKCSEFKETFRKVVYILLGFAFFIFVIGVVGLGIYLKQVENSLPDPNKLIDRSTALSTQIYDRKGVLLYTFHGPENREFIKIEDIPEVTKMALIAAEDVGFYQHKGLDITGIIRAGLQYLGIMKGSSGASTLTQQYVRNTALKDALGDQAYVKTPVRKLQNRRRHAGRP